jgi:hypothetical protein
MSYSKTDRRLIRIETEIGELAREGFLLLDHPDQRIEMVEILTSVIIGELRRVEHYRREGRIDELKGGVP